jgi:surfactin synthase thioesterase subunit
VRTWGCILIDGAVVDAPERWFGTPAESVTDGVRLFCLPYAGGGATAYRDWPRALPRAVRVEPIRLPGRETRVGEPAEFAVSELAGAIATRLDGPYAVYGHSMGGRVGFELVRELRERGLPLPLRLYVGASRPPRQQDPLAAAARLDDEGLIARVTGLGGTPAGVFAVPELRELLVPVLRADFGWLDAYRYRPGPPLPVPIVALAAVDDPALPVAAMLDWEAHSGAGFRLHTLRGGHFFLTSGHRQVAAVLAADLLAARTGDEPGRRRPLGLPEPDEAHLFRLPACGSAAALARVLAGYGTRPDAVRRTADGAEHPCGLTIRLCGRDGDRLALATRGRDGSAAANAIDQAVATGADLGTALTGVTRGIRLRYENLGHENLGHENLGHENLGYENLSHENLREDRS